ncbi:MAG: diphthine--ammonia ligase [Oscillospiraceae bacterium]|nr:diphthine--ammonia ligase [Oscillospiraceae bacterium]
MNEMSKVAVSYSGGKDSALAFYRARKSGYDPISLVITYNNSVGRSWFHGVPEDVLRNVAASIGLPIEIAAVGSGDDYGRDFESALERLRGRGVQACVFGDIDIAAHKQWCETRCHNADIKSIFPLWQENRRALVYELIDAGFKAVITIVDTTALSEKFLGKTLTRALADEIDAAGADICGENGEYHSFVYDGPIFNERVNVTFRDVMRSGNYAILPVTMA